MRIRPVLAWTILLMAFFTAGLLRQFNDRIPNSPWLPPIVGSALFAAIFLLLLVTARERRRADVMGPGIHLGTITPLMLMLLIEKWFSLSLYPIVFSWMTPSELDPRFLDVLYRAFAGVSLILVCIIVGSLSRPTIRRTRCARFTTRCARGGSLSWSSSTASLAFRQIGSSATCARARRSSSARSRRPVSNS